MTFDESHGKITESLTGRTIEYVSRQGKVLSLKTTCGHEINLQADDKGDIHFKGCSVSIELKPLEMFQKAGSI